MRVAAVWKYFFLLFSLLPASVALRAQVSVSLHNKTLDAAFGQIKKQTGYGFLYNTDTIQKAGRVTLTLTNVPLQTALDRLFEGRGLQYEIDEKTIIVRTRKAQAKVPVDKGLQDTPAADVIGGIVKDEKGNPMPDVSVSVKGRSKGVYTDKNGHFSIAVSKGDVLEFSYVGYSGQSIKYEAQQDLAVALQPGDNKLEEVVAIGYGTQKKSDLTGSVSSIKSEQIQNGNPVDVLSAIQGKLAGVSISSSSGAPGAALDIKIRGYSSINSGTTPLFVIDGMPYDMNSSEVATATVGQNNDVNPLAYMNTSDIASITVLKDASATAIYGSRGANGVILIETKKGRDRNGNVNIDFSSGLAQASRKLPMLSGNEFIEYERDVNPTGYLFYDNADPAAAAKDPYSLKQHNWQKEMLRVAPVNNLNFSLSGKSEKTSYVLSVGALKNGGIVKNNNFDRYTARLNLDHQKSDRMKLGMNTSVSYFELTGATQSGGGNDLFNGIVQNLVLSSPVEIYNPTFDPGDEYISPSSMIDEAFKRTTNINVGTGLYMHYTLRDGLTLMLSGSGFLNSSKADEFYSSRTYWGVSDNGYASIGEARSYSFNSSAQLQYTKKISPSHSLNAMVGTEKNLYNFEYFGVTATNFIDQSTGVFDISKAASVKGKTSTRDRTNRVSFFGRINYTYKDKHLLTVNMRADGSDKFGSGNRYGYFPSVAYAWKLINEKFMESQSLLSNAKFRLSYGLSGNDRIPSYRYLARLENTYYDGTLGLSPSSQANNDLKWETTSQANIGFDFGLFGNAVEINVDAYEKRTRDMLMEVAVSGQSGYAKQWRNIGRLDNRGIELQLHFRTLSSSKFSWTTDLNISRNKNIVRELYGSDFLTVSMPGAWIQDIGRVVKGYSIGQAYGYQMDGVYQTDDFTWQNNSDPTIPHDQRSYQLKSGVVSVSGVNVKPGSFKFRDRNKDNVINLDDDRTPISKSDPTFYGGLNNTFKIKQWDINIFIQGSYGNQIFNESKYRMEGGIIASYMNITKDAYYNHWTPNNPSQTHGDYADRNATATVASSYYVEDASFLRLKTVSVGYTFSDVAIRQLRLRSVRLYLNGGNLFTLTKYTGFDPEVSSGNILMSGVDRVSYPRTRNLSAGISVNF